MKYNIQRKEIYLLRLGRQLALPNFSRFCDEKTFVVVGEKSKTRYRIYWANGTVTDVHYFEYFPEQRLVIYVPITRSRKDVVYITHLACGERISLAPIRKK